MALAAEPQRPLRLRSRSSEATMALGRALGQGLWPGAVVALDGELGSGKTCMVRGIALGLGVGSGVQSPSFTLLHEYRGRLPVFHLDAWMEAREVAFLQEGGAEWLRADGVSLVEWAARVERFLPRPHLAVRLQHVAEEERWIDLELVGGTGAELDRAQAAVWAAWQGLLASLVLPAGIERRGAGEP
jgi:tRNA threonylcarbamoyladenosine biosynthesis protein TsaE